MLHPAGSRLGPYEIVSAVGAGGMGDVYKARDTRLDRTVAVKVAKERFEERFRNEALTVAALNHPHIGTLFDVGPDYLVMEYVDGKALRGPLPVGDALRLAGQIADALEHAHRHGVVHRDLKPSNILLTKSGVKVLDFGLAKRQSSAPAGESRPTLTEEGAILGTPRYMAPEQIEGKPADERTDVFAFGLVLYEMLTGRHAFGAGSAASAMAGILEREPTPISALMPATPPELEQVVLTCLAKDPAERWQSVRELRHALAWAARPSPVARGGGRSGWIAGAIAASVAVGALTFAVARRPQSAEKGPPVRFQINLPDKATSDDMADIAVSPDGRKIVLHVRFGEVLQLYVRPLDSLDLTPVPGTENAFQPFWSPDGRQIAFASPPSHALKKVDLAGGPAQTLCKMPGFDAGTPFSREGATWSREDVIVFSAGGKLFRVPARGGEPEALGKLAAGETGRYWPQFLPDGRHYLYLSIASRPEDQGIYVGSLDSDRRTRIVASEYQAAYSPPGRLLFVKDDALMAQPFDATTLSLSGEPIPVLDQLALIKIAQPAPRAIYSVSASGVLAWRPRSTLLQESKQLTWFDRSGKKLGTLGEPAVYFAPTLSPDDRSVAVCRMEPGTGTNNPRDLWIFDVARGTSRPLTFDPADDCGPAWSPDGSRIAFFSDRRGVREIYQKAANGSGDEELLLAAKDQEGHDPLGMSSEDWSADGRFLVYNSAVGTHFNDLFLLPMSPAAKRKPVTFLATEAAEHMGTIAPNGRWMAYRSDSGGRGEIYVSDMSPRGERGPGKWQISSGGGWQPRWRRDGKELFYAAGSTIMSVAVSPDAASFEAATPRPLFDVSSTAAELRDRFAVTRDGQRFLLNLPLKSAEPVRVLVNGLPQ
jgi:Tol biopolymer transport system component